MILTCVNCDARFLVADRLIPQEGRVVRCGSCHHEWHVDNPQASPPVDFSQALAEELASPLEEMPEPDVAWGAKPKSDTNPVIHNVPALAKRGWSAKPFKRAVPALAVLWALLALFTYYPHWVNAVGVSSLYGMMGVKPTTGLAFAEVKMQTESTDTDKTRFLLTGNIINHASVTRIVPEVKVQMKDKNSKSVWSRTYPVNEVLEPGQTYPFRIMNAETSFAESVNTITLDMGNSLQIMNR